MPKLAKIAQVDAIRRIGSGDVAHRLHTPNADGSVGFGTGLSRLSPHEPIFRSEAGRRAINRVAVFSNAEAHPGTLGGCGPRGVHEIAAFSP
jgi:hypothetical protein